MSGRPNETEVAARFCAKLPHERPEPKECEGKQRAVEVSMKGLRGGGLQCGEVLRAPLRELPEPWGKERATEKNYREVNQQSLEWAHGKRRSFSFVARCAARYARLQAKDGGA